MSSGGSPWTFCPPPPRSHCPHPLTSAPDLPAGTLHSIVDTKSIPNKCIDMMKKQGEDVYVLRPVFLDKSPHGPHRTWQFVRVTLLGQRGVDLAVHVRVHEERDTSHLKLWNYRVIMPKAYRDMEVEEEREGIEKPDN